MGKIFHGFRFTSGYSPVRVGQRLRHLGARIPIFDRVCRNWIRSYTFLPGDSLLFAAGALAVAGALNVYAPVVILAIAAILGDTANYWIGYYIGPKIFRK